MAQRLHAAALHPGAVEHYEDALAYERRYASRTEDVQFYCRRARGSPHVLEYGAGAGRLTLALGRQGASVLAVDSSARMVELLRRRLRVEAREVRDRVRAMKGDMRRFSTSRRFDLVLAGFHTVCHLYSFDDMRAFLRRVWTHLHPGGRLVFDVPLPRIDMPDYDPLAQVRVTKMYAGETSQLLTQRWYQPQEILMHLAYAGFVQGRLRADFGNEPIGPDTSVVCVFATKPKH